MVARIDPVESDVSFNDLRHQLNDGAPAGRHRVQNVRALGAFLKRSFDGIKLAP